MQNQTAGPITDSERIDVVDVLRGLAILGILIGNMQWFSGYGMVAESLQAASFAPLSKAVQFLVHFFIEGKFYSIFSFLFGFGFALQIAKAKERGDTKASVFKRRLMWLFVIGAAHAVLLWAGDILTVYALMGFVLVLFRNKSDESLIKWIKWLIIVPVITYAITLVIFKMLVPPDTVAQFQEGQVTFWWNTQALVSHGSWIELLRSFNLQYLLGRWIGLVMEMRFPKVLAMFLIGVWTYRRGILADPPKHLPFIRRVFAYGMVLGLIGNTIMAALAGGEAPMPPTFLTFVGVIGYAFGVPALALGIAAGLVLLYQGPMRSILSPIAAVGRMALTNYLLQTITCVTIFYGYGLGRFGSYSPARATLLALGIFAVQIALSNVWLTFFRYGPMEWIWRQLTYGRRLKLRLAPA